MLSRQEKLDGISELLIGEFKKRNQKDWRYTQAQFATDIGVDPRSLNTWMNKRSLLSGDNIDRVAAVCGPKTYDILEIQPRMPENPVIARIIEIYYELDPGAQKELEEFVERLGKNVAPAQV